MRTRNRFLETSYTWYTVIRACRNRIIFHCDPRRTITILHTTYLHALRYVVRKKRRVRRGARDEIHRDDGGNLNLFSSHAALARRAINPDEPFLLPVPALRPCTTFSVFAPGQTISLTFPPVRAREENAIISAARLPAAVVGYPAGTRDAKTEENAEKTPCSGSESSI